MTEVNRKLSFYMWNPRWALSEIYFLLSSIIISFLYNVLSSCSWVNFDDFVNTLASSSSFSSTLYQKEVGTWILILGHCDCIDEVFIQFRPYAASSWLLDFLHKLMIILHICSNHAYCHTYAYTINRFLSGKYQLACDTRYFYQVISEWRLSIAASIALFFICIFSFYLGFYVLF